MSLRVFVVLAIAAVAAAPASSASSQSKRSVVRLVSTTTSLRTHDVAPKGLSVGDWFGARDTLTNEVPQFGKQKGALVGSDVGIFRIVKGGGETLTGTTRIPDGTIRIGGPVMTKSRTRYVVRVVGGTGRYASARGTVTVVTRSAKVTLNVFVLTL